MAAQHPAQPLSQHQLDLLVQAASGEEIRIFTAGVETLPLPVDPHAAVILQDGDDLLLVAEDGATYRLQGYVLETQAGALSTVLLPDGSALSAPALLDEASDMEAIAEQLATLETQAGTAASAGGGGAAFDTLTIDPLSPDGGPRGRVLGNDELAPRLTESYTPENAYGPERDASGDGAGAVTTGGSSGSGPYVSPPTQGQPGPDSIVIYASGHNWNGWPQIHIYVDGVHYGTFTVDADASADQMGAYGVTGDFGPGGPDKVEIRFSNAESGGNGGERSLFVDGITVNGEAHGVDGGNVSYERDGLSDLPGQEDVDWNGTLVFDLDTAPSFFGDPNAMFSNGADDVNIQSQDMGYGWSTPLYDSGNGNDIVRGGIAGDRIDGGRGDDTIYGEGGADSLYGAAGNDTLMGGAGDDFLYGGRGDDVLDGGDGNDRLMGGSGADTFRLSGGVDRVSDFAVGVDRLDPSSVLNLTGVDDIDNYLRVVEDGQGNSVVQIDESGSGQNFADAMVLEGVTGVDLTSLLGQQQDAQIS